MQCCSDGNVMRRGYWDAAKSERGRPTKAEREVSHCFWSSSSSSPSLFFFLFFCCLLSVFWSGGFIGARARFGFQSNGRTTRWNKPGINQTMEKKKKNKWVSSQLAKTGGIEWREGSCSVPYHTRFIFHLHIFIGNGVRFSAAAAAADGSAAAYHSADSAEKYRRSCTKISQPAAAVAAAHRRKSRTCGRQRFSLLLDFLSKSFAQGIGPAELSVRNPLPLSHSLSLSLSSLRQSVQGDFQPNILMAFLPFSLSSSLHLLLLLCFSHLNWQREREDLIPILPGPV